MNIGDKFFCSRCLTALDYEMICPICNYDPSGPVDPNALEEGTILCKGRFQVGAVYKHCKTGFIYGSYDFLRACPVFLFEFFPNQISKRDMASGTTVIVKEEDTDTYIEQKNLYRTALPSGSELFEENNTFYVIDIIGENCLCTTE